MGAIAGEIVNTGKLQGIDWVEVSSVFSIDSDGDVKESYGYAYDAQCNAHAVAFLQANVEREVKAYREWLRQKGEKGTRASSRCSSNSIGTRDGSVLTSNKTTRRAGR